MKCPKCGAELTNDAKFCSYCGSKIDENGVAASPSSNLSEKQYDTLPNIAASVANDPFQKKESKLSNIWKNSAWNTKAAIIAAAVFLLLCLVAFINGSIVSGILAVVSLVLLSICILISVGIIKLANKRLSVIATVVAVVLLVPYFGFFNVTVDNTKKYDWSTVVLNTVLPQPESEYGEIISNSQDELYMEVYKTSPAQFISYVAACTDLGFTIDSEQTSDAFDSFNTDGYQLDIDYYESENKMELSLDAPEVYETIEWPADGLATLLPKPVSQTGRIVQNDASAFEVYVAETTLDAYKTYVAACKDNGFDVQIDDVDDRFSAENQDGYRLTVEYIGFNRIHITALEPEYEVNIEVTCIKNLAFSTYDVEVFVDDSSQGELAHGTSEIYTLNLTKGNHKIRFEESTDENVSGEALFEVTQDTTVQFQIYCTESEIQVESPDDADEGQTEPTETTQAEETTEPEEEHLTVDNCPELAAMLKNKASNDPSYAEFAEKYEGRIIEFDGRIDYCTRLPGKSTRFDYLVSAGDYDPNHAIGPAFKFEDVAYYDLNTDLETVSVGLNVHIVAEVEYYDSNSELFFLDPISVTAR